MQSVTPVAQPVLSKQEKLYLFLRRNRKSIASIAREMDMSRVGLRRIFLAETAPPERVSRLIELGIPQELLPEPLALPAGPKPGWKKNLF